MKLVCLDNHALIWGIKEEATDGQELMIPRAKAFIESLDNKNYGVLIPTIVIGEFLMRVPSDMHAIVMNLFNRSFIIAPFDMIAASKFAEIWQNKKSQQIADELFKSGRTREELKADRMIVAIAVSRRAECIYSHDKALRAFAQGYIDVKEIPFISKQTSAFEADKQDWGKLPKKMGEP